MTDTEYYVTVPQKTGHTFGGYYTEINGSGMQFISSSGNITSDFTSDKYSIDVTLYA